MDEIDVTLTFTPCDALQAMVEQGTLTEEQASALRHAAKSGEAITFEVGGVSRRMLVRLTDEGVSFVPEDRQ